MAMYLPKNANLNNIATQICWASTLGAPSSLWCFAQRAAEVVAKVRIIDRTPVLAMPGGKPVRFRQYAAQWLHPASDGRIERQYLARLAIGDVLGNAEILPVGTKSGTIICHVSIPLDAAVGLRLTLVTGEIDE